MHDLSDVWLYWHYVYYELLLFSLLGFLIGGIDEVFVDTIWITRTIWRRFWVFSKIARVSVATLAPPVTPGEIAVFIAAWDESDVINAMLTNLLAQFGNEKFHVFLGCYPNDPKTIEAAIAIRSPRITIVVNPTAGPTTKADCLNSVWQALEFHETSRRMKFKSILLHDAEDVVHRCEPRLFDKLIERFDLVQIPVLPLPDEGSRWIAGHYCDEFAESHGKSLVVREAIGAAVPSAGVGCAISRSAIQAIANSRGGSPFDDDSLTEDYELGLRIKQTGGRTILVRIRDHPNGQLVAIRAHFPASLDASVRQKTRWIIGISLAGWDRLGWHRNPFENWMRFRDRRAPFAAVILCVGYIVLVMTTINIAFSIMTGMTFPALPEFIEILLAVNLAMLVWRMIVRVGFVTYEYDWKEGLRSVPRIIIGNIIAIIAARRAMFQYAKISTFKDLKWDKTQHKFPDQI